MKILIVKTSSLGDIVHTFPAVSLLKKIHPQASIDWVVEQPFAELLEAHPYIDNVISIHTKKWRKNFFSKETFFGLKNTYKQLRKKYDILFDFQGNTKSGIVTAFAHAKIKIGYGFQSVWEHPNLLFTNVKVNPPKNINVREEYLFFVHNYFKTDGMPEEKILLRLSSHENDYLQKLLQNPKLKEKKKIFVAPGSNWKNKQLDSNTLKDFLQLVEKKEKSCFLITYGNDAEKEMAKKISQDLSCSILVEKLSLPLLQNVMAKTDLVIAMDSLPLHLAAAAGVHSFSIFGPSSASIFAPAGPQHQSIQGKCPYHKSFSRRCPILRSCSSGACIKNIKAEDLLKKFL